MNEPFQSYVLFNEFPKVDAARLKADLESLESGDDSDMFEVSDFAMRATEEGSVLGGVISQGGLNLIVQVLPRPLTEGNSFNPIEVAALPEEQREQMRQHRVHAQLTCMGAEGFHPVEPMILQLKVAMALMEQGGTGYANESNCTCFPPEIMNAFAEQARIDARETGEQPEDDDEHWHGSLWDSLRSEGLPGELLVGFLPADVDGQLWFLSAGHSLFGLPELAYQAEDFGEIEEVEEHFKNIFYYMFENGPVLGPGHSMGYDEQAAFSFEPLPEDRKQLEGPHGTLLVKIADPGTVEE